MDLKACLFDLDGVIVDSAEFHFKAWRRMAAQLSIDLADDFEEEIKGVSRVDSLDKILAQGDLVLDNDTKVQLMAQKNSWYLEMIADMGRKDILPGVLRFLEELRNAEIKIGLGSSSQNATKILGYTSITEYFDVIVDGTHLTFSKPDPEVFLKGATLLGIDPDHIVVFEDAASGVDAAISGGFRCVGVGDPKILSKATTVIPNMREMTIATLQAL